jgi:hypothetical protein
MSVPNARDGHDSGCANETDRAGWHRYDRRPPVGLHHTTGRVNMDQAQVRYRKAMIAPRSGGKCRYCGDDVDNRHVQTSDPKAPVWCADCHAAGTVCSAATKLATRAEERATARTTR